jgi:DNA polymerase sigma
LDEKNSDDWIKKIDYISSATVPIIKMITEHSGVEVKVDLTYGDDSHRGKD